MTNQFDKVVWSDRTKALDTNVGSAALNAALIFSSRQMERLAGQNDKFRLPRIAPATD